jgi:predicted dehydrogenase
MMNTENFSEGKAGNSTRRDFLRCAAGAAAFTIVPSHVLGRGGKTPPSDQLNVAGIGVGGMGANDIKNISNDANIVALCDVDEKYAAKTFNLHPQARKYADFRIMLEKQKDIDAVHIATPDHNHFMIAMAAIDAGKHVYCQKPMTHSIYEARKLTEAARQKKVITQMGIQGHAGEASRLLCEWIWDGAIGKVREVHAWTDRPGGDHMRDFGCGLDRPKDTPPVPEGLNWDLWLGPAQYRPYHPIYLPVRWRGWWDFGTGAMGDMGCHVLESIFWALKLGHPTSVEASSSDVNSETAPVASLIYYEFPARGDMPAVKLTWYDGGLMPKRPDDLEEGRRLGNENGGVLFIGEKGKLMAGCWGDSARIIPESKMKEYKLPSKTIPRTEGIYKDWIASCKSGKPACANFDFSGPLTEAALLGNIAIRMNNQKLYWDGPGMKITNVPEANKYVQPQYRNGWTL